MYNNTDHDDNPYHAAAKINSEEGLLPYKDYRYIHMPYYVFVYSLILKFTPSLTIVSKIINLFSFYTILILIFNSIQKSLSGRNQIFKFLTGASAILFIIYNPLARYSFARFTYELPLLLSVLAFFSLISITDTKKPFPKAFLSGLLLGIAIGFRLHFVLLAIPFALSVLLFLSLPLSSRLKLLLYFSAGAFAGLIPVFVLFIIAPKEFIFDIYQYHFHIDKTYQKHIQKLFPLSKKLEDLYAIIRESWQSSILLIGAILIFGLKIFRLIKNEGINLKINVILLSLPFLIYLIVGKILIIQYIYPLFIFLILGIFYGLTTLKRQANFVTLLFCSLAIIMLWQGDKFELEKLRKTEDWNALSRYQISSMVDEAISGPAKVLTLSPAEVLENDSISIYKEFVSSPFIWRTSYLVPDHEREELNIISEKELSTFLKENQPDAFLTGYEPEVLEREIIEYARHNGYTEIDLPTKRDLKLYIKNERFENKGSP